MTYFVILLVTIFVLGPILWLLPSNNQRHQMVLRRTAMTMGMQVRIDKLYDPRPIAKSHDKPGFVQTVTYLLPWARLPGVQELSLSNWQICNTRHKVWQDFDESYGSGIDEQAENYKTPFHFGTPLNDDWSFTKDPNEVLSAKEMHFVVQCVNSIPSDVYILESTRHHIVIYWTEAANQDDITQLYKALDQLQLSIVEELKLQQQDNELDEL